MCLQAPARLIANNAGVEGDVIVEKLLGQPWEQGYNAMDDRIENLMEAGIIDPAKVLPYMSSAKLCDPCFLSCLWTWCNLRVLPDNQVSCCSSDLYSVGLFAPMPKW